MAELFGVQTPAISKHLRNIFSEGELQEKVVVSKMEIPTPHGAMIGKTQLHETTFYNLDAIISVPFFPILSNHRSFIHFRFVFCFMVWFLRFGFQNPLCAAQGIQGGFSVQGDQFRGKGAHFA